MDAQAESNGLEELRDLVCQLEEVIFNTQQLLQSSGLTHEELEIYVASAAEEQATMIEDALAALNAAVHNPAEEFLQLLQEKASLEEELRRLKARLKVFKEEHRDLEHKLFDYEANSIAYHSLQVELEQSTEELQTARVQAASTADAAVAAVRAQAAATRKAMAEEALQAAETNKAKAGRLQALTCQMAVLKPEPAECHVLSAMPAAIGQTVGDGLQHDAACSLRFADTYTTAPSLAAAGDGIVNNHLQAEQRFLPPAASCAGAAEPLNPAVADGDEMTKLKRVFLAQEQEAIVAGMREVLSDLTSELTDLFSIVQGQPQITQLPGNILLRLNPMP